MNASGQTSRSANAAIRSPKANRPTTAWFFRALSVVRQHQRAPSYRKHPANSKPEYDEQPVDFCESSSANAWVSRHGIGVCSDVEPKIGIYVVGNRLHLLHLDIVKVCGSFAFRAVSADADAELYSTSAPYQSRRTIRRTSIRRPYQTRLRISRTGFPARSSRRFRRRHFFNQNITRYAVYAFGFYAQVDYKARVVED